MSGEGLCNWEQLENHSGPHISVLLVLEEVAVGLGFLEVRELPGPSNLFLRVCKTDTGSIQILSRSGSQMSSLHWRNTLLLLESEQPSPSKLRLLVYKKDTGSIRILSTLDWLEGSQHQKSRIQQVGFDLLRNCSGLHTFHCQ